MNNNSILISVVGFLTVTLLAGWVSTAPIPRPINILIITGGHDFEHKPFYDVFNSMPNLHYDTMVQPLANALIATAEVDKYDVLVFYDMFDSILPAERQAYIDLLKKGKAMIFLHHSLVSYQNWDEFKRIIGGRYHTSPLVVGGDTLKSSYEHDVRMPVAIKDKRHPITSGIDNFEILDEVYGGTEILSTVKPLLSTTLAKSMPYLAWVNHYGNSDVVYIQLGHGPSAYANKNYRRLLQQSVEWSYNRHSSRPR